MLERLKRRLGLEDDEKNTLLQDILDDTEARLCVLLEADDVPEELAYIVLGAAVKAYNRIGSEGASSHTVEGETLSWAAGDFDEYADDIQAWRNKQTDQDIGRIRFL